MAPLLYYRAGTSGISKLDLADLGLLYAEPEKLSDRGVARGPDGRSGCVFWCGPRMSFTPDIKWTYYAPAEQTWTRISESVWAGIWTVNPPKPADLERRDMIRGHLVRLGDDNDWLIPVARRITAEPALPRAMTWDGDTWQVGDVLPRYRELWDFAVKIHDCIVGTEDGAPTLEDECNMAAKTIGYNYRVGMGEISLLGLLTTQNEGEVLKALIDWPTFESIKKKLDHDTLNTSHGGAD